MENVGLIVSNEGKDVLKAVPFDLSFSADFNMFKIKQEIRNQVGETTNFDHGLGYFPFFLAYIVSTTITDGKALAITSSEYVTTHSGQIGSNGYMFVCFNPGVQ